MTHTSLRPAPLSGSFRPAAAAVVVEVAAVLDDVTRGWGGEEKACYSGGRVGQGHERPFAVHSENHSHATAGFTVTTALQTRKETTEKTGTRRKTGCLHCELCGRCSCAKAKLASTVWDNKASFSEVLQSGNLHLKVLSSV